VGTEGTSPRGDERNGNERNGKDREPAGGTVHNDFRGAHFTHSQVQGSGVTNIAGAVQRRAYLVGSLAVAATVLIVVITWGQGADSSRDADADAGAPRRRVRETPSTAGSSLPG